MMKRSFFTLSRPRLTYELLEPNPEDPITIDLPLLFTLLLQEPVNGTRQALIQKGNAVTKGQRLRLYEDSTEYVLSPVAGTIKSVDHFSDDVTGMRTCITIEKNTGPASDSTSQDFKEDLTFAADHLQTLPGAPPFDILADENLSIRTIVIMGADTDLLTTTAQYMSTVHADTLKKGIQILKQITNTSKIYMTRPGALNNHAQFDTLQVLTTHPEYPETLPAMIMKNHLEKILPAGKTPEEMGICFIRAEAVVSLARAFETKAPVFEKHVTLIDKNANRHRIKTVIGTPLSNIFSQLEIQVNDQDRIIIGGPMRGFATFTIHHPVTPDMDTVVVQDRGIIPKISDTPCVNCGKCVQICPAAIQVNLLVRFLETNQYEEATDKYDLDACIECGLCTYVCTSQIALGQYIRLGKQELYKLRADV
ncbi:MAG: 4Fe-4S dicluster domain-containing protein [Desulfotignum sp.]